MPLITIHVLKGSSKEYVEGLSSCIHTSLVRAWNIPMDDKFHVIHEHERGNLCINKVMWGVNRSDNVILIQVTSIPRSKELKLALYKECCRALHEGMGVRKEDVMISVVINKLEDWSFGNGEAQLL